MSIAHTSLGVISVSGPAQNGWTIALFFEQTARDDIAAEAYILDPEGNDISIGGQFTITRSLVTTLAGALKACRKAQLLDLTSIPEDLIEKEIVRLSGIC